MENYRFHGNSPLWTLLKYMVRRQHLCCPMSKNQVFIPDQGDEQGIAKDSDCKDLADPNRSHGHKDQVL